MRQKINQYGVYAKNSRILDLLAAGDMNSSIEAFKMRDIRGQNLAKIMTTNERLVKDSFAFIPHFL